MAREGTVEVRIVGDAKSLNRALGRAESRLGRFGSAAKRAGLVVAKGLAVGAAAVAGGSVKAFADFDAKMTESLAIMDDVSDAMRDDMSDAARQVAKTTKFSADEAAEAYYFLASASLDAEESIDALPQVANFAQAGMFDMATATDLATDAQSALGLKSEESEENLENLTRVTDVFSRANQLANASVEQFATSMTSKAGAALRNVNKDVEEGTATLSAFADEGIKGERAGTILRATLDGLSNQARKNEDAFADLNVQVFDGQGEMRNLADIIADVEDAVGDMSTEEREAALAQLGFNKRAREGILALLGKSDAMRDYEDALRSAGGATEEVASKQLDTFWEQLGLLKDQIIDVGIELGSHLTPVLTDTVVPALSGAISWVGEFAQALSGNVEEASSDAVGDLARFDSGMEESKSATEVFAGEVRDRFQQVRDAVADWWEQARPKLQAFWQEIQDNWPTIQQIIANVGGILGDVASIFNTELGNMATNVEDSTGRQEASLGDLLVRLEAFTDQVEQITDTVSTNWNLTTGLVLTDLDRFGRGIDQLTGGALTRFMDDTRTTLQSVKKDFRRGWLIVQTVTLKAVDTLQTLILGWAETTLAAAEQAFSWIPGLDTKLEEARSSLETFRKRSNAQLDKIRRRVAIELQTSDAERRLNNWLASMSGKSVTVQLAAHNRAASVGDGPGRGGAATAWARRAIAAVPGRQYITSTYRTPAHNARVGGSPTSYHLDRHNPATDIGGANLAAVYRWLQTNMRPIRELLGPGDPGHSDHVHVAHRGGQLTQQGIRRLRSDEMRLVGQVGEEVLTPGDPRNISNLSRAGAGVAVNVARGAVQVSVYAPGSDLSEARIAEMINDGIDRAGDRLGEELLVDLRAAR